jgi:predicted nucleic acid-binding protein
VRFVDSNILIRYLSQDDPAMGAACLTLFERVEDGDEEVTTREAIVAEVVHVLASPTLYGLAPADIEARLKPVLELPGVRLPQKRITLRALELFALHPRLDYPDALCVAHMEHEGLRTILSYDRDFDRVPGIVRDEP